MKYSKDMSERLKSARKRAGFRSARAFAMEHDIPYVTYSQHEAGNRRLNPDTLVRYATLLNVSPAWILSGEEVGKLYVSENNNTATVGYNTIVDVNTSKKYDIDADLFLIVFDEIHAFLTASNSDMSKRDGIKLCVDFYNVISGNVGSLEDKRAMLKNLLRSIALFDKSKRT